MLSRFADIPEALQNSVEIAKRCNLTLTLGKNFLPQFPTPDGMNLDDYIIHLSNLGLQERLDTLYPNETERAQRLPEYQARLDFELKYHHSNGFSRLFSDCARFHQLGETKRLSSRARTRFGCRFIGGIVH